MRSLFSLLLVLFVAVSSNAQEVSSSKELVSWGLTRKIIRITEDSVQTYVFSFLYTWENEFSTTSSARKTVTIGNEKQYISFVTELDSLVKSESLAYGETKIFRLKNGIEVELKPSGTRTVAGIRSDDKVGYCHLDRKDIRNMKSLIED